MQRLDSAIDIAAEWISQSDGVLIAAGAGMGVDSGLPDFRGNEGFWKAYPALGNSRMDFQDIANAQVFAADPRLAWGFYGHRLRLYRETVPHFGFSILKRIADHMEKGAFVFTSNVDGHFQEAGFSEQLICECHGSIRYLQCAGPCMERIWPAKDLEPIVDESTCRLSSPLPKCECCSGIARPNILMFDDWAWINDRTSRQRRRFEQWKESVVAPIVIEIGAGIEIATVRRFSESQRCPLIRINPREASVPQQGNCIGVPLGARDALERLWRALREKV